MSKEIRRMRRNLFLWMLCQPLFLLVYWFAWRHFTALCMYGGVKRHGSRVLLALLLSLVYLGIYFYRCHRFRKNGIEEGCTCRKIEENRVYYRSDNESTETAKQSFSTDEVWHYRFHKNRLNVFLKTGKYISLDCSNMELPFVKLKMKGAGILRYFRWGIPAVLLLILITAAGSAKVIHARSGFNGKLGWFIDDLKTSREVTFQDDNLYQDGLEGMLAAIREKVPMPECLMVSDSFRLDFLPDGTITSLDTMLYGYDETGNFVDSYLITYNAKRNHRIKLYLGGSSGAPYDENQDFGVLCEALRVIPVQNTVSDWKKEKYGILYKGIRTWTSMDENIYAIDRIGNVSELTAYANRSGYSISIFCPENEKVTPYRFLYRGDVAFSDTEDTSERKEDEYVIENGALHCYDAFGSLKKAYSGTKDFPVSYDAIVSVTDDIPECWVTYTDAAGENRRALVRVGDFYTENHIDEWSVKYTEEDYGTNEIVEQTILDQNDIEAYDYSIEKFFVREDYPYAEAVNAVLGRFYEERQEEYEKYGSCIDGADYIHRDGTMHHPSAKINVDKITYIGEDYFSILFVENMYEGGAHGFPVRYGITIDLHTGELASITDVTGKDRKHICTDVTKAFLLWYGYVEMLGYNEERTDYRMVTAGAEWYQSYETGNGGAGFYLLPDEVVYYYGNGEIAPYTAGFPEVLVGR